MEDLLRYSLPKRIAGFIAEYAQARKRSVQMFTLSLSVTGRV